MAKPAAYSGFTIVEILIVIAVTAVLATIVSVGYSGITRQAHNNSAIASANQYETVLRSYLAANGEYPEFWGAKCLGIGYPDRDEDGVGDCGPANAPAIEDPDLHEQLLSVIANIPKAPTHHTKTTFSGEDWVGIWVLNWDDFYYNGARNPYSMQYQLDGPSQDCRNPNTVMQEPGEDWPRTVTSTTGYTFTDGVTTNCIVALPKP
jgi:prepilin-type N-terminal cleavage/methylation domain-containing protein